MARTKPINPDAPPPPPDPFAHRTVDPTIPVNTGREEDRRTLTGREERDALYLSSVAVPASQLANTHSKG